MADEITLHLAENYNAAQIREFKARVFAAHLAQVTEPTTITGISGAGESLSMTIAATNADREKFMQRCRAAIAILDGDSSISAPGIKLDFSLRRTAT